MPHDAVGPNQELSHMPFGVGGLQEPSPVQTRIGEVIQALRGMPIFRAPAAQIDRARTGQRAV